MEKQQLIDLKSQIEKAKEKVSQLTGRKDYLYQQLEDQWKCHDLQEASDKLQKLDEEITALKTQLQKGINELQEKYDFE